MTRTLKKKYKFPTLENSSLERNFDYKAKFMTFGKNKDTKISKIEDGKHSTYTTILLSFQTRHLHHSASIFKRISARLRRRISLNPQGNFLKHYYKIIILLQNFKKNNILHILKQKEYNPI